ncbi:thioredoxin domain-containing protein, partial [Candidatus Woesearchaeota archaeon]|nr:thioredoxin domain-containing protein [Candidatus Woesearchaeota archaeon]
MPAQWLLWEKKSFEKARKENKPILLDLSAVWCHWCHRMDRDNYERKEIYAYINQHFVPIKVDIDKRPDIRERYNFGGFPTTAFLAPDGSIITGTTYVFPEHFLSVLQDIQSKYAELQKQTMQQHSERPALIPEILNEEKAAAIIKNIADMLKIHFDDAYGGFGMQPKFPAPEAIVFCLERYQETRDELLLTIATKTLDGMQGIFDEEEGGFFRYSVTRDWNEPHYEKMLDVNAGLIQAYTMGFEVTGKEQYKKIAEKTIQYVLANLSNDAFYGSQDADEEYYELHLEQRKKGKKPFIDKTIYTNTCSMMIVAFLKAAGMLKKEAYKQKAIQAMEFLLKHCYQEGKGMYHYFDQQPFLLGL